MIYLDHAASTPINPLVVAELTRSMTEDFANPSAAHRLGRDLQKGIEAVRRKMLKRINAQENEGDFIFTASATESNNQLLYSAQEMGKTLFASTADHPSLLADHSYQEIPLTSSEGSEGDLGRIDKESLLSMLQEEKNNQAVLVLALINNHSGNDHSAEWEHLHLKKQFPHLHLHLDIAQAFGKVDIDVQKLDCDSLTFSAHKMGGPKGIGALWIRKKAPVKLRPMLKGGGHEKGMRASTMATPLIMAWGKSLDLLPDDKQKKMILSYKEQVQERLLSVHADLIFPFTQEHASPYILTFITPMVPSDILLRHLEEKNIFVSTSSACSSKSKQQTSPVFQALGVPLQYHKNVLRVSFWQTTTEEEITRFISEFNAIYCDLKRVFHGK